MIILDIFGARLIRVLVSRPFLLCGSNARITTPMGGIMVNERRGERRKKTEDRRKRKEE